MAAGPCSTEIAMRLLELDNMTDTRGRQGKVFRPVLPLAIPREHVSKAIDIMVEVLMEY